MTKLVQPLELLYPLAQVLDGCVHLLCDLLHLLPPQVQELLYQVAI